MKLNIENYFKSLITKIKNIFSKNQTLNLATKNTNLDTINASIEKSAIIIPTKIDGSKDFSVIHDLIKKYESGELKEKDLDNRKIKALEEYYYEKNISLKKEIEYELSKINSIMNRQKDVKRGHGI